MDYKTNRFPGTRVLLITMVLVLLLAAWVPLAPAGASEVAAPAEVEHGAFIQNLANSWRLPFIRQGHSTAYDATNNRLIAFGGWNGRTFSNNLWALDLTPGAEGWTKIDPDSVVPPARGQHSAIYDAANDRMIVFGGRGRYYTFDDVWSLDLTPGAEAWTQLAPAGAAPSSRRWHSAIYDAANGRIVVFGGGAGGDLFGDTWSLDLTPGSETWSQLAEGNPGPSARGQHSAIYDANNGLMVVLGGQTLAGLGNDAWALNLSNENWIELTPTGTPPAARRGHTAVYDGSNSRMLLFGGLSEGQLFNDLWELMLVPGSVAWNELSPGGTAPTGRAWHTGMLDGPSARFIVIGGHVMIGDIKGEMQWSLALDSLTWATFTPSLPEWWQPGQELQDNHIQASNRPQVVLEIEDAFPGTVVNLMTGIETWFVVNLRSPSYTYSQNVDVTLQVNPNKIAIQEWGQRSLDWNDVSSWNTIEDLGDGRYRANDVDMAWSSSASEYRTQVIFKAWVGYGALEGYTNVNVDAYGSNWQAHLTDSASPRIYTWPEALFVTNRDNLFGSYNVYEVQELLEEVFEQAQGGGYNGNPTAVVIYADRYLPDLKAWNNRNVDYTGEMTANDVANQVDDLLEDLTCSRRPNNLVIVGDDDIVPYYRQYDETYSEQEHTWITNGEPVLEALVENNYFFTDNPYGSTAYGTGWEQGDLEIAVGRIVGASADDMRLFLSNAALGPSPNTGRAIIASGDGWDWRMPGGRNDAVYPFNQMGYYYNNALVDENPSKTDITREIALGATAMLFGGHGSPTGWSPPAGRGPDWPPETSEDIVAWELGLYDPAGLISRNRTFFHFGACRVGMSYTHFGWDSGIVYALIHYGASGGMASGGLVCCVTDDNTLSIGEALNNEVWIQAYRNSSRTDPLGWSLMQAKDHYDGGAVWTAEDDKVVQELIYFGLPWTTIDAPPTHGHLASPAPQDAAVWSNPQRSSPQAVFAVTTTVDASTYAITPTAGGYDLVHVEGLEATFETHEPVRPIASIELFLPMSATVTGLVFTPTLPVTLTGLDLPSYAFAITDTAIIATYTTTVSGTFPVTSNYNVRMLDTHQLVQIHVVPLFYDAVADEGILYQRVDVQVEYDTPQTIGLTHLSTDQVHYAPGDTISVTASLINVGDVTETVTATLFLLDAQGQIVGLSGSGGLEVPAGGVYDLNMDWSGALDGDAYLLRLFVWHEGQVVAGAGGEVFVTAGEIDTVETPDLLWPGQAGTFTVTVANHTSNLHIAVASLAIYDADDTLVALLNPGAAVLPLEGSAVITFTWTPERSGRYAASVIAVAGGYEYGPVSKHFTVGYHIFLPLLLGNSGS